MKSKAAGCGSISTVIPSIVLLCVSSIIIIIKILIIIIMLMGSDSQRKDPRPAGVLDRGTFVVIMRTLSLVREESGLSKRIRSLWSAIYRVNSRLEAIEAGFMAAKRFDLGIRTKIS